LPPFQHVTESVSVILIAEGRSLKAVISKVRVTVGDVLTAGSQTQGLERMEQIKWAVLETDGGISIFSRSKPKGDYEDPPGSSRLTGTRSRFGTRSNRVVGIQAHTHWWDVAGASQPARHVAPPRPRDPFGGFVWGRFRWRTVIFRLSSLPGPTILCALKSPR
jgi:hypothetical protein